MTRVKETLEGRHSPASDPPHVPVVTVLDSDIDLTYEDLNKADLKAEAARRGLGVSGNKRAIRARLEADDIEE